MPSGGSRKNSGRKLKWEESSAKIGVPQSLSLPLLMVLEDLWEQGWRTQEITDALRSVRTHKVKKYDYPVSAGSHSTSSVGGDSMNTDYEEIDLQDELIGDPGKTIVIPVTGDSMIGIGIYPGDWLIVEQINPLFQKPREEDIVIVAVNDEILVKRYRTEKGSVILASENENYEEIREVDGCSIYVSGIVKYAIRRNL
ncbi:MAG: LexA family protein [Prochlorothrix sp.]